MTYTVNLPDDAPSVDLNGDPRFIAEDQMTIAEPGFEGMSWDEISEVLDEAAAEDWAFRQAQAEIPARWA